MSTPDKEAARAADDAALAAAEALAQDRNWSHLASRCLEAVAIFRRRGRALDAIRKVHQLRDYADGRYCSHQECTRYDYEGRCETLAALEAALADADKESR